MARDPNDSGLHASEFPTSAGAPAKVDMLGGNELRRRVGQGGMGEVWLAWDTKLHRHVALKTMRPDWAKHQESSTRFYTEARSVAKLNHPNIVQIYQIGEDKGLLFFTMEWVDGQSLEAFLRDNPELPVADALDLTIQILEGLHFACQHQVIHRDIKPANCLMDKAGRVKLADFGLAKMLDSDINLTSSGISMGSPNYMSPEMAKGERADHRADMYAVGLTLYQMLTGKLAFSGPTATAVLLKQVNEELPITDELVAKAGVELVTVIKRMCAKYPEERFETYDELLKILKKLRSAVKESPEILVKANTRTVQLESVPTRPSSDCNEAETISQDALEKTRPSRQLIERPEGQGIGNPRSVTAIPMPGEADVPAVIPPAKSSRLPLIGAALAGIVIIGAAGIFLFLRTPASTSTREPNPVRTPIAATTATIRGEIAVTGIDAAEFVGAKVLLYDGFTREQFNMAAEGVRTKRQQVVQLQHDLNSTIQRIESVLQLNRSLEDFTKQRTDIERELAEIKQRGDQMVARAGRIGPLIANLEKNLLDFRQLGHSNLPCVHPVTEAQFNLTTLNNRRDESIAGAERVIVESKAELARLNRDIEELKQRYERKDEELKVVLAKRSALEEERRAINPRELESSLRESFPRLVALQQQLVMEEEKLASIKPTTGPAGEATISASSQFDFTGIRPGEYLLVLDAKADSGGAPGERRFVWLMDAQVRAGQELKIPLSAANAMVNRRVPTAPILKEDPRTGMVERAITIILAGQQESDTTPLARWTRAVLRD